MATPAAIPAADTPRWLCRDAAPQMDASGPGEDAPVLEEARRAEASLAPGAGSTAEFQPAALPLAADHVPSLAARGAYCAAIGEMARRGRYGTALDAGGYLLSAFRYAEQAGAAETSARAAYRLALALNTASFGVGGRGAQGTGIMVGADDDEAAPAADGRASRSLAAPRRQDSMLGQPQGAAACDALMSARRPRPGVALSCAAARGDPTLSARSDLQMARLLLDAPVVADQALAMRHMAGDLTLRRLKDSGAEAPTELDLRLAESAIDALRPGDTPDPALLATLRRVEASADSGDADGDDAMAKRAYALALLGRIAGLTERGGADPEAARAWFERAIALESRRALPSRLADWYMLLADADPDHRSEHVRSAYAALSSVRRQLPLRDPLTEESTFQFHERRIFESRIGDVLNTIPTVSLDRADHGEQGRLTSAQIAQLRDAQNILEDYRQAEVSDALGTACLTTPNRIQAAQLRPDEAILYPVILPDRVELLYLRGGGGPFRRLPPNEAYNRQSVSALVAAMRRALVVERSARWQAPSRELYNLLIRPVESQLGEHTTLVVIPDAILSALPFAALEGDDHRFLIQKTRLVIAPSLAYAQPGADRTGGRAFVAAGSLDRDVPLTFGVYPRLVNAAGEARAAAGWDGASHVHPGLYMANFTPGELRRTLQTHDVDILHLATHASFSGGTDKSFIVANGGFISLRDLSAMISDTRLRGKELDLLVLSACETAVGDDRSSLGLAGAAVQSGAHGAIASLWEVDDESTKNLMLNFYRFYRAGASKSEAIQRSEMQVMQANANPYYWASLILVGGWR